MTLWTKDLSEITGAEVQTFCDQKEREGLRLDYKKEIPKKLANIVAAFANTHGGLILIGVDADKTHNLPIRPLGGMTMEKGIEERITSMCQSKIYPPVEFEISQVLDNPENPGTGLVVLRVPVSPEAPHAIDGKVYERVRSQNDGKEFYEHADIENIRHLLDRRASHERIREGEIQKEIRRAVARLGPSREELREMVRAKGQSPETLGIPLLPLRWFSVIPLYPWRDVCTPGACYRSLSGFIDGPVDQVQRVPGGASGLRFHPGSISSSPPRKVPMGYASASRLGHIFEAELPDEAGFSADWSWDSFIGEPSQHLFMDFTKARELAKRALVRASDFFEMDMADPPAYLQLSLGILDALHFRMYDTRHQPRDLQRAGGTYPDQDFRAQVTVPYASLSGEVGSTLGPLLTELEFGFDRPTAPSK